MLTQSAFRLQLWSSPEHSSRSRGAEGRLGDPGGPWLCRAPGHTLTQTLDAIAHPTVPTATLEAAGHVDAGGVHVAVVSPDLALVHIWTNAKTSRFPDIQKAPLWR